MLKMEEDGTRMGGIYFQLSTNSFMTKKVDI